MNGGPRFFLNAPLAFGWGSLAHLRQLPGRRAAIVTDDAAMEQLGFLEQAVGHLQQAGLATQVVARVAREPATIDVDAARLGVADFAPDWIVALGGGSVLDTAKALWVFCERPDLDWEAAFKFNGLPPMRRTRLVAVPSTSGTGSETSRVAVIVDAQTGMKRLIFSPEIIPTLAILDPALPAAMPPPLTAASAFDALSHAIEASLATIATEFTVSLALGAIRLIFRHLPASYHDADPRAREQMHYAATMAGMAINNSTAGLAHGMDQVGPLFGVPHGVVCAILLPYTLSFSLDAATARLAEMGRALGLPFEDERERAWAFLREYAALQQAVNLPLAFKDVGIAEDAYRAQLGPMIEAAQVSGSTRLGPKIPSADETRALFLRAYHGQLPEALTA
jgi:alcohol dehydrogenase class IV